MNAKRNGVSRKHLSRKSIVVWTLVAITSITLASLVIQATQSHKTLDHSVDQLRLSLKQEGVETEKEEGCAKQVQGFGESKKHCAIGLQFYSDTSNQYMRTAETFRNVLERQREFFPNSPRLQEVDILAISSGKGYKDEGYIHRQTGQKCSVVYQYIEMIKKYNIQFSCDETSWFTRTFENVL